jgi:frataxin-like iron-binding protein CyaY
MDAYQFDNLASQALEKLEHAFEKLAKKNKHGSIFCHSLFSTELNVVVHGAGTFHIAALSSAQVIRVDSPITGAKVFEWSGKSWIDPENDCYLTGFLKGEMNAVTEDFLAC